MKLQDAKALAELLLEEHGLDQQDWQFEWITSNNFHGRCFYKEKVIALSHRLTSVNTEATVHNTLLHEISHALVGSGHGHDDVWRAKAAEIGAVPQATCRATGVKLVGNVVTAC